MLQTCGFRFYGIVLVNGVLNMCWHREITLVSCEGLLFKWLIHFGCCRCRKRRDLYTLLYLFIRSSFNMDHNQFIVPISMS